MSPITEPTKQPSLATVNHESLEKLLEISTRLSSTLQLNDLLSLVMEVATELTNTEASSILLLDQSSGQLHFVASSGSFVPEDTTVPLDSSIAGWVVRNGRSLILDDVQTDDRFYANIDKDFEFHTSSMLAVPLTTHKGVIGCLEVLNKLDDTHYSSQDVAILEALASQSAVAILNARLFSQSDLLAEIMHEVKTPLMAITTASELLARPELPESKRADVVTMIQRESKRLSRMTKEFVDFARLETGRMSLKMEPVNLSDIITDVVGLSLAQAEARPVELVVDCAADLPGISDSPCLIADRDRLQQVLLNLVSNGIKYNQENGRLAIISRRESKYVYLAVADTGKGIAPEAVERLFERFYRVPGSEGKAEGSGLGLAITKKIVEQHNGRISVNSVLDKGTTFTIELPLTNVP
ncbi:MAG: GAF domain-containing sensor histidine kinase [Anaerolineae bacterium]|nr:GAF domain-containing sensor histidine kinase [Anaerolineae bacterium]